MLKRFIVATVLAAFWLGAFAYAHPKVAALDYSGDISSTRQALLARFDVAIVARSPGSLRTLTDGIHSRNAATQIAVYAIPTELPCSRPSSTDWRAGLWDVANKADFWLRHADGSRVQWTSTWATCMMNLTQWGKRDAYGHTWAEDAYTYYRDHLLRYAPYAMWWFSDNGMKDPRVDADFERIGTNQSHTDPTVVASWRQNMRDWWELLHNGGAIRVMSNVDSDLSFSPYNGDLRGAFYEGAIGRSWSTETWSTWGAMLTRYRAMLANTYGHVAVMQVYGSTTDYRTMRYGLASAMMDDGYYCYLPSSGTLQPTWYDEYSAPVGAPVDAPPTGPKQNGIWMRRYQNGLALVNPSKTATASIYVGSGYRRLSGSQDPSVNNGQAVSTVTLGPRSGLILVKN